MVDYVRMIRSGIIINAIKETVPRHYAMVTIRLLRAIAKCFRDSFHENELEELEVRATIHAQTNHFKSIETDLNRYENILNVSFFNHFKSMRSSFKSIRTLYEWFVLQPL